MKLITDCSVHLVSRPEFIPHPEYELPPDGLPLERLIATAGKLCYDSYGPGGNPVIKHVNNLVGQQHFSVIEHANYGFVISGISRGLSHELVRHRHFSYSQRSTRYTAEEGGAYVLEPYLAFMNSRWTRQTGDYLGMESAEWKVVQ
jgi:flavin-dependent thymidylate synthase